MRSGRAADNDTPEDNVETKDLADGKLLDQDTLRKLSNSETDEESGGHPGEVISCEVEVLGKTHDVGIVDEDFVEELEEVTD